MASAKFQMEKKCEICGKYLIAKTLTSRYCSKNCSQDAYKQRKKGRAVRCIEKRKGCKSSEEPALSLNS